jgi:osmotically inducible protein OsmC
MAAFTRKGESVWTGGGKDGSGKLTGESGAISGIAYSAGMRFGEEKGTNPEELIALAHAGCFNMALAFRLAGAGHPAKKLTTSAAVRVEQEGGGWTVRSSALTLTGDVPGIDAAEFQKLAADAKANCPISRLLKADITLDAKLVG